MAIREGDEVVFVAPLRHDPDAAFKRRALGSLKDFPINTVKIDRVFIKEITKNPNIESIVKAIIAMAHSLNMKVVAEGVETEEQWAFLDSHQCDEIQGYLCSKPVPADEFEKLLKNGVLFFSLNSEA